MEGLREDRVHERMPPARTANSSQMNKEEFEESKLQLAAELPSQLGYLIYARGKKSCG